LAQGEPVANCQAAAQQSLYGAGKAHGSAFRALHEFGTPPRQVREALLMHCLAELASWQLFAIVPLALLRSIYLTMHSRSTGA